MTNQRTFRRSMTPARKPVLGFEQQYAADEDGLIWALRNNRPLKPDITKAGYAHVQLCRDARRTSILVHKVITGAFLGPRPQGTVVAHLNGKPADNRIANLAYVSPKENEAHKVDHGTKRVGEQLHWTKLTAGQVLAARAACAEGANYEALARQLGVTRQALSMAVRGKTWKHLK